MPGGIQVLYVDDEPGLLEIARLFLEQSGEFRVGIFSSALEALNNSSLRAYDAIVSDYQMPEMDGIAFLKEVRERFGDIPFILFTGRGREEVVIDAINNGADFYLQKGGDPTAQFAELAHKIRQAVTRKKSQDELRAAYEQITASEEELREQYEDIALSQQKLLESQQQLTEIASSVPGVVYQTSARADGSMEVSFVSSRAPEVFGISNDLDLFIDLFTAQVDSRDRNAFLRSIREAVSSESSWNFEGRFIKTSGETIWFQGLSRPVKKGSGLIYNGVLLDITSRKKAEEELRESGRKLREAQGMAHLGFWSWDVKTGQVEWSDEIFRIFGLDPNEFTPQIDSILELSPWPGDHQRDKELIRKAIESREPGMYEQRFLRPDKSTGYYYSTFQGRYDQSGNLTSIIGTVLDITGRKRAEEARRQANLVIENSPVVIFRWKAEEGWPVVYVSQNVSQFGYTPEELLPGAMPYSDLVYQEDLGRVAGEVERYTKDGTDRFRQEYRIVTREGDIRWVEDHTVIERDAGGKVTHYQGILLDITEKKRAEEALEKRLVALTRPLEDTDVAFEDLFDLNEIQQLQDEFAQATGVAVLLTRPDGTPITKPSNFCRLCSEIVRRTPAGRERCYKSDSELGKIHEGGPYIHVCLSAGLWGAGTNIVVGNRHIANWLIGQVRNETQTEDHMRAYARVIGVDEEDFIKAFHEVPVMSSERFRSVAQSLSTLANQISKSAYQNIQQARFIAERKRAEDSLRESEERLRLFIQHAPAALAMFDREMRYLAASRRWIADYHLGDHDILGRSHYEVFPEISEELKAVHRRSLAGEVLSAEEDPFVREDGSVQWITWEVRPWYTTGNVIGGIIIFSEDITWRKKAEEALRESEEKYRTLVEKANEAITIIQDWRMVYANSRMVDLVGIPAKDLLGMEFLDTVWPDDREMLRSFHTKRYAGEEVPETYDFRMTGPEGKPRWIHISIAKILWQGRPATLNLMSDITERKSMEHAIREANRKLNLLNSLTRHDILNQLITLQGFTHVAAMKEKDPVISGFLVKIDAASATISQQIGFMKTYQELGVLTPGWFRLGETVAKAGRKKVVYSATCNDIEVFSDPMIEKVFFNLFDNALQHGGHVTEIGVRCEEVPDGLIIIVEDNGIGIPPGEKEKIFEKGFGKKTGLGLFLAKEILSITGITIRENGTLGKGAKFEITVPNGKYRIVRK